MLKPLGHRVLIKPEPIEKETAGGIIVVKDERLEKAGQMRGVVVALGDQAFKAFREIDEDVKENTREVNGRPWVQPGDQIVYARYAGKEVEDPTTGEIFLVLNDDDIVLHVSDGPNPDYEPREYRKSYSGE